MSETSLEKTGKVSSSNVSKLATGVQGRELSLGSQSVLMPSKGAKYTAYARIQELFNTTIIYFLRGGRPGEMAQLLACKHEDLGSGPSTRADV